MKEKNKNTNENKLKDVLNKENIEPDSVTREINLDELYDGAINNTTIIDPVTNDEVLLKDKKPNFTLIGVALAVLVLLVLYYLNNKTELGGTIKEVEPKTTTNVPINEETTQNKDGTLTCTYSSHSDSDTQTISYTANYENNFIINSEFNFDAVSNNDLVSAVIEDLKSQYENYYINNVSLTGSAASFEKEDKGFTFNVKTNYETAEFDSIIITEGQTILYVKPNKQDTYEKMLVSYTEKGFSCSLSSLEN